MLGVLELLGIVRPLMFSNLLEIRNAVEHQDAPPPDKRSCQIFLEFVWYFLRSTDRILQLVSNEIHFSRSRDETSHWLELKYGPSEGWNPTLRGWVGPDLISTDSRSDWITVLCERSESYA